MYQKKTHISRRKTTNYWWIKVGITIIEYQKISNLLDNKASNQPFRFRTKNWVEINDAWRGTYTGSDIKFKTTMLRSNLCGYADAYILFKGIITITGEGDDAIARQVGERNKGVTFKN